MRQAERFSEVLESLAADGALDVVATAERLGVSASTIRRDLQVLEEQRMLTRTHGGAVAHDVLYELPLRYKAARKQEEKRRIAANAATRVDDGAVVGLTGGTTTTEVARALVERRAITVVTNALNIAGELAIRADVKLVVTGGTARTESYELSARSPNERSRGSTWTSRSSASTASRSLRGSRPITRSRPGRTER